MSHGGSSAGRPENTPRPEALRLAERKPGRVFDKPGLLGTEQWSVYVAVRSPRLRGRVALLPRPDEPSGQIVPRTTHVGVRVREQQVSHEPTLWGVALAGESCVAALGADSGFCLSWWARVRVAKAATDFRARKGGPDPVLAGLENPVPPRQLSAGSIRAENHRPACRPPPCWQVPARFRFVRPEA
jgi:hypothetical protein